MSSSHGKNCESHFWPKVMTKNGLYHFYPSAKSRRELKVKTLGVIFRSASAYYVQKSIAPPDQTVCRFSDASFFIKISIENVCQSLFFGVEKWNVGDHLKRVFPKFEAKRSHPRRVNRHSNFFAFSASKNEMSEIAWNAFSQSLKPNRAILRG